MYAPPSPITQLSSTPRQPSTTERPLTADRPSPPRQPSTNDRPSTPRQTSTTQLPSTPTQPSTTQRLTTPRQPSTTQLHVPSTPRRRLSVESPQLASILSPIGHTVPRSLFGSLPDSLPDSQPEVIGLLNQISEQQKQSIHFHKLTLQRLDALIAVLSSPAEPAPSMHQPASLINQPLSPPAPPREPSETSAQHLEPSAPPAEPFSPPNQIDDEDEVIFQLRAKSTSAKNFAVNLVRFYFTPQELDGRNVRGVGNKLPLDPVRIEKVMDTVFKFFPSSGNQQDVLWRDCHKAIDGYLRNRKPVNIPRTM